MAQPQPVLQKATVKSILSGDTIILRGQPRNGPPPERTLGLAHISAPRVGRRPTSSAPAQEDEPCAWQAREFLRKKLVGNNVAFVVEYTVPSGREYGNIILEPGTAREENLMRSLVAKGLAKIRDGERGDFEGFEELKAAQTAAQEAKLGVWADDASSRVRSVTWNVENPRALVDSHKSKPIRAIVEQVRDGCTLRVFLLPKFEYITLMLSGIKTPIIKRNAQGEDVPEPFAQEAQFYVESRLLQREVEVILEGVSNNNFLGSVIHPKGGNISLHLLKDGFAKIVDWSIGNVTSGRDKYRSSLKQAQKKNLRIWKDWKPPAASLLSEGERKYKATVVEIVNAESLVIKTPNNATQKINLASLRGPKLSAEQRQSGNRAPRLWEIPHAFEAREFLRKKLVGKRVDVTLDYIQPANNGYPEKHCCTVFVDQIDVGEALVSKGLATTLRHKSDDDQRSSRYDDLLAAETRAVQNGRGVHSGKDYVPVRVTEVTNKALADRFLPGFQRAGRVQGAVEFIASGSRVRVFIPRDSCIISVVLAGIDCPRTGRNGTPDEPFSQEAAALTRSLCLQHDVDIEVEDSDKGGNMIGHIYIKGKNLSTELLSEGLCKTHFSVERYKNRTQYTSAEQSAKDSRKNIWANYDPVAEAAKQAAAAAKTQAPTERKPDFRPVVVTEVDDDFVIYTQTTQTIPLGEVMNKIASEFRSNPPVPHALKPKKGDLVAGQFTLDNSWYRAKVLNVSGNEVEIQFVDYGNKETVTTARIASLPAGCSTLPPQAQAVKLAFTSPLPSDWQTDALIVLRDLVLNKLVLANTEYTQDGVDYVSLKDEATKVDLAKDLMECGFALLDKRREPVFKSIVSSLAKAQNKAKTERLGIWVYGDITGDEL